MTDIKNSISLAEPVALEVVDRSTGEIISYNAIPVVTVGEQKFKTNYTDNSVTNDAEINSGEYVIDDSEYIDYKKLLLRSKKCGDKAAKAFLENIPVVDNVGGIAEEALDEAIASSEVEIAESDSEVISNELSTGEAESPQEAQEASNPVDKLPDGQTTSDLTEDK